MAVLLGALLAAAPARAAKKDDMGIPVKVIVLDHEKKPLPTAVIRHPLEQDRHRVNSVDGSWRPACSTCRTAPSCASPRA